MITKYRNRLSAVPGLRTQLSNIKPNIKRIFEENIKDTLRIEKEKHVGFQVPTAVVMKGSIF
jgi:hypothetical protein